MLNTIYIQGYKSIQETTIDLSLINVLVGANGAGKSNFISFFEFLQNLYEQRLEDYVAKMGGASSFLFQRGFPVRRLSSKLIFGNNAYQFNLELTGDDSFKFDGESLYYYDNLMAIKNFGKEAKVKEQNTQTHAGLGRAEYINQFLGSFRVYHFHDTGLHSPFSKTTNAIDDSDYLYSDGSNLAAVLLKIKREQPKRYLRIRKIIKSVVPSFGDFYLENSEHLFIRLRWKTTYSDRVFGTTALSDGSLRFVALTVLFNQPRLPKILVIDEPELGLHPVALRKVAGMIKAAATAGTQVIAATQSVEFINQFAPEDVLAVDQDVDGSKFKRLDAAELSNWLRNYSLGELWQQRIIESGQPGAA